MTLYDWALRYVAPLLRVVMRVRAVGREQVPQGGGAVLCANHRSNLDPVLLSVAFPRRVRYMAKAELFRVPLLGPLVRTLGAFPVHRGEGDRNAIRTSFQVLKEGDVLGMFPEAHRNRRPGLMRFKTGAVRFAAQTRVPIVPAVIVRRGRWPFGYIEVRFGAPVTPRELGYLKSEPEGLHPATDALRARMLAMLEEKRA